jgi:hypothetical protein
MLYKIVMRAFFAVADHSGLRRLVPEDAVPADVLRGYATGRFPRPTTVAWALLEPGDAEAIQAEVGAGRHGDASGLLLNRALELLSLAEANPEFAGNGPVED